MEGKTENLSEQRIVDTNCIVRFLIQDDPRSTAAANRLFQRCDAGEVTLLVLEAVVAECVYVLESVYQLENERIASQMSLIVTRRHVVTQDQGMVLDALARYATGKAEFVDCLIAATAAQQQLAVATFDKDFRRFKDIRVDMS